MINKKQGKLICVGTGMRMAGQLTPIAQSYIETSDVVIAAVPNIFARKWLQGIAKEYICLLGYYSDCDVEGKSRRDTYRRMVDTILAQVRAGKTVCAAFYGHPGVFACVGHMAILEARAEGYSAQMEPGISAEDCLVADLGIDPAQFGAQSMETTQFMIYQRKIDPTALLILWQPGLAGELSLKRFDTNPARLQILVNKLARDYPLDHPVILYEAATHPLEQTRMDTILLKDLPAASLQQITTLVIPPARAMQPDQDIVDQLNAIAATPVRLEQAA
ncbi:MAG: SAM-dependent methyltransferase [Undibacterium sp.]|uniref:SAM-dependent methyltransferase n=1 Tax=Undibacterium sp. TaxID=1914977 RepID=UPI002725863D|nr:SAM-dependent methyltransferase [Undibacterium sp.]MDO8652365.1 SAM-dependent methyltransferase [Undibacterium sp.]